MQFKHFEKKHIKLVGKVQDIKQNIMKIALRYFCVGYLECYIEGDSEIPSGLCRKQVCDH